MSLSNKSAKLYIGMSCIWKRLFVFKYPIGPIRKWLQNQDDYSLQKPVRRNFKRDKVIVHSPSEQLDVDLVDMQSLSKDDDGIKYLLVAIDVFSRNLLLMM
jgi:hypothetical protein